MRYAVDSVRKKGISFPGSQRRNFSSDLETGSRHVDSMLRALREPETVEDISHGKLQHQGYPL